MLEVGGRNMRPPTRRAWELGPDGPAPIRDTNCRSLRHNTDEGSTHEFSQYGLQLSGGAARSPAGDMSEDLAWVDMATVTSRNTAPRLVLSEERWHDASPGAGKRRLLTAEYTMNGLPMTAFAYRVDAANEDALHEATGLVRRRVSDWPTVVIAGAHYLVWALPTAAADITSGSTDALNSGEQV